MQTYSNSSSQRKSTAARVGPRQFGPPASTPGQREFVLDVLRRAGDSGISKNQFRDGNHALLQGRRVVEIAARICELEESGFIFEHVKGRDRLVTYILRSEPLEPKPVQSAPRPSWNQGFAFGNPAKYNGNQRTAPQPINNQRFLDFETGRTR